MFNRVVTGHGTVENIMVVGQERKAMDGDLAALRLVLDRVYPVRDATMAELLEEMEELRHLVETRRTAA